MSRLIKCLEGYNSIAVTGICKNAGKTTVVNHLINQYKDRFHIGLSSIGYDGEEKDMITRLDKPRINVFTGMTVATCEECLRFSTAGYTLLGSTGIRTILGEVLLVKITSAGIMEVSGPPSSSGISALCEFLRDKGCQKIIIDGAAGRLSFAPGLDCTVLSAGAAFSQNMGNVVRETKHLAELLNLRKYRGRLNMVFDKDEPYVTTETPEGMLFAFRGPVDDKDIIHILRQNKGRKKTIVVNSASSVFITPSTYMKYKKSNGNILVRNISNLAAVAINPMSPYEKWFDKDRFMDEMKKVLDVPVINVMDEKESDKWKVSSILTRSWLHHAGEMRRKSHRKSRISSTRTRQSPSKGRSAGY